MTQILLTDVETAGILGWCSREENKKKGYHIIADEAAKAQLKKVVRWCSDYCELKNRPRRECEHCWQELLKEVRDGN